MAAPVLPARNDGGSPNPSAYDQLRATAPAVVAEEIPACWSDQSGRTRASLGIGGC